MDPHPPLQYDHPVRRGDARRWMGVHCLRRRERMATPMQTSDGKSERPSDGTGADTPVPGSAHSADQRLPAPSRSHYRVQDVLALTIVVVGLASVLSLGWHTYHALTKKVYAIWGENGSDDPWQIKKLLESQQTDLKRKMDAAEAARLAEEQALREQFFKEQQRLEGAIVDLQSKLTAVQSSIDNTRAEISKRIGDLVDPGPEPELTKKEKWIIFISGAAVSGRYVAIPAYFKIRHAAWWAKRQAFDHAKAEIAEIERRLKESVDEEVRLRKAEATARIEQVTATDQYEQALVAMKDKAAKEKATLEWKQYDISKKLLDADRAIGEAAIGDLIKRYAGIIWNEWLSPVLHLGLIVTLFLFIVRTSFRLVVLRGWIGTSRV